MKEAKPSKKSQSSDVVSHNQPSAPKSGPTELSTDDLKNVSGGLPRGGPWRTNAVIPKKDV